MLVSRASSAPDCSQPSRRSTQQSSITDYAERTEQTITAWKSMDGQQGGDPAKLADAMVQPRRPGRAAGTLPGRRERGYHVQRTGPICYSSRPNANRELSSHLDHDET